MTFRLLLISVVLAFSPGLAIAQCYGDHAKEEIVMSCVDGTEYNADTQKCEPASTS